jgi:hypothetical protein
MRREGRAEANRSERLEPGGERGKGMWEETTKFEMKTKKKISESQRAPREKGKGLELKEGFVSNGACGAG